MPTFGFSAYLKLICLNSRPQRSEIRKRLAPKDGGGYDFHKSLRILAHKFLIEGERLEDLILLTQKIVKDAERNSAQSGLNALADWRSLHPGAVIKFEPATFTSPSEVFKVSFTPDFGLNINGRKTAIHIWNTKKPDLEQRFVYGALALFPAIYAETENRPDDLAILSLRDKCIYCLSDVGDRTAFGLSVATAINNFFEREAGEFGTPIRSPGPVPFHPSHLPPG